jgi:phosphate transport system permease protein
MTRWRENLLLVLSWCAGLVICGAVGALVVFLLGKGWPVLGKRLFFGSAPALDALLGLRPVWDGIWPAVAGTLYLLFMTLAFAVLPGVGCGIFLACYATPREKYWLRLAVDLLAGIPSIVMGLFGFVLIIWLRRTFLPQGTTCLLLSSFCLALLVLPSLVAGTCTALEALPEHLTLTAAALGFSCGQTVRRVLLPAAGQGILGGVMLAMGRAAEDTAVIMLTGVVANAGLPSGLTAKFEALPFRIYYTVAQYADQQELQLGFGTALVLLCLSGSLLFCAWALQRQWERRWKGIRQ